ncbi:GNAT family N-acetyltransferase [Staphylococcus sp. SQ8-PEA]|uniref:GNAT family N-acetyltransferase n=1 Tax=Staphylococcus marylandisciuri TaxID=2981529 RepID=A0ABT2QMQ5_9STAP|nr:GNAT family N-acetyltransferase [Staphylococcus marylandisciuri]MCU5745263.1 GNAT family N-acetyltransferase [Staphylococcus marylandisciuri]
MGEFVKVKEDEVEQLRKIAIETFDKTFGYAYTTEDLQHYYDSELSVSQLLQELRNDDSWIYFYREEDEVLGYFKFNINDAQTEPMGQAYLQVQRIYLLPQVQRGGIGKQIIDFAEREARRLNKVKIWLGVWDQNDNAISFYKGRGFIHTGTHEFRTGSVIDHDLIMEKDL